MVGDRIYLLDSGANVRLRPCNGDAIWSTNVVAWAIIPDDHCR